jgi:hypothetical protein
MSALKFKLTLEAKPSQCKIEHGEKIMLMGSCFTENIGSKLQANLFEVFENSHGILFNPVSVQNALMDIINNKCYQKEDLIYLNEVWNSWHHHSRFSAITQEAALEKINQSIQDAHLFLQSAQHLIITLGSAWLYTLNENAPNHLDLVVANNHKAPANWFDKKLMSAEKLSQNLKNLVGHLHAFNPNLHIVFTISPVRHLREGLVENNRSKSVLIQAVHDIVSSESQLEYFPAYEYVIDDLRDYRFYAEDLVHPNYAATQYVWEKLIATYMSPETQEIMKQIGSLQLAIHHKPMHQGSVEHQQFLLRCIDKTTQLMSKYPFLPLQKHLLFFQGQVGK